MTDTVSDLITRLEEAAAAQPLLLTLPPQPTALAVLLREAAEALRAMLAASPQGEGSSADAHPPQPDALPGDLREKVRGAMKAWAQEDCSTGLKMMLTPKGFCDLETRILSLIQSERGGA